MRIESLISCLSDWFFERLYNHDMAYIHLISISIFIGNNIFYSDILAWQRNIPLWCIFELVLISTRWPSTVWPQNIQIFRLHITTNADINAENGVFKQKIKALLLKCCLRVLNGIESDRINHIKSNKNKIWRRISYIFIDTSHKWRLDNPDRFNRIFYTFNVA